MTHKLTMISAAVALALGASTAHADFDDMVSVRGFGTMGAVHSTEDQADVVGSVFQPDGAGYTRGIDVRGDSRVAGQVSVRFTDKLSLTAQAITQYQYDGKFTPNIEWLNLKYSFTPALSARIGRIALPTFLVSDSRMVGYANTAVRPPEELYKVAPLTNSDGVDLSYSFSSSRLQHSVQTFYGMSKPKIPAGDVDADTIYGANYQVEAGSALLRVAYTHMDVDLELDMIEPMFDGLRQLAGALSSFGFATAGAEASALVEKYKLQDINMSFLSLAGSYDPGAWFVIAEALQFSGDSLLSDARAGYVTAGARFGKLTPYATLAEVDADTKFERGISTTGLPGMFADGAAAVNAGLNMTLNQFQGSQQSVSAGMRWDAMNNIAVKGQYSYVDLGANSAGKLLNPQPGFVPGGSYSVYSLTVDFIF